MVLCFASPTLAFSLTDTDEQLWHPSGARGTQVQPPLPALPVRPISISWQLLYTRTAQVDRDADGE
jgi:hypothetical protein